MKCRFTRVCRLYKDEYTCNDESEASWYCGAYREFAIPRLNTSIDN